MENSKAIVTAKGEQIERQSREITFWMRSLTTEGSCHSIDIAGTSLTERDQKRLEGTIASLVGGLDDSTAAKIMLIWKIMLDDGWSHERFAMALETFKRTFQSYGGTWTPKAFVDDCSPGSDLHDQSWYEAQSIEDRERRIENFVTPEGRCLYRFIGSGPPLPGEFERVWPR